MAWASNVFIYDSDTQDKTGQTRLGWSTWGGVQGDPYRWGRATLAGLHAPRRSPGGRPGLPRDAARSVDSPQSIAQAARQRLGLSGGPRPGTRVRILGRPRRTGDALVVRLRSSGRGTAHVFAIGAGDRGLGSRVVALRPGVTRVRVRVPAGRIGLVRRAAVGFEAPGSRGGLGVARARGARSLDPRAGALRLGARPRRRCARAPLPAPAGRRARLLRRGAPAAAREPGRGRRGRRERDDRAEQHARARPGDLGQPARHRGADRRRADEDDRVQRHHAAAHLRDGGELERGVHAGGERDGGGAQRDQRRDLQRQGRGRGGQELEGPERRRRADQQRRPDAAARALRERAGDGADRPSRW